MIGWLLRLEADVHTDQAEALSMKGSTEDEAISMLRVKNFEQKKKKKNLVSTEPAVLDCQTTFMFTTESQLMIKINK